VFSQDPNNPNFDPDSFVTSGTVSASAQVDVAAAPAPEPASLLTMGTALLALAFAGLRRGKVRRS
jgi:PEP-CTERM motif